MSWRRVGTGAGTDVFLGYHSEEGWTAAIHLLTKHYGYEVEVCGLAFPGAAAPGANAFVASRRAALRTLLQTEIVTEKAAQCMCARESLLMGLRTLRSWKSRY